MHIRHIFNDFACESKCLVIKSSVIILLLYVRFLAAYQGSAIGDSMEHFALPWIRFCIVFQSCMDYCLKAVSSSVCESVKHCFFKRCYNILQNALCEQ